MSIQWIGIYIKIDINRLDKSWQKIQTQQHAKTQAYTFFRLLFNINIYVGGHMFQLWMNVSCLVNFVLRIDGLMCDLLPHTHSHINICHLLLLVVLYIEKCHKIIKWNITEFSIELCRGKNLLVFNLYLQLNNWKFYRLEKTWFDSMHQ